MKQSKVLLKATYYFYHIIYFKVVVVFTKGQIFLWRRFLIDVWRWIGGEFRQKCQPELLREQPRNKLIKKHVKFVISELYKEENIDILKFNINKM
jgi:hypothetical protein